MIPFSTYVFYEHFFHSLDCIEGFFVSALVGIHIFWEFNVVVITQHSSILTDVINLKHLVYILNYGLF